jgi:Na+/H+ antiporter NhaA
MLVIFILVRLCIKQERVDGELMSPSKKLFKKKTMLRVLFLIETFEYW